MKKRTKPATKAKCPAAVPAPEPPAVPQREIHHTFSLLTTLYRRQMEKLGGKGNPIAEDSSRFIKELMLGFKARDPVEEMLFGQMVLTYSRMAHLSGSADEQTNIKWATMMHEATDRAANTFRRQMLALAEYRRPPRANSFTAIGQANIAQQQVVQNRNSENEKTTNEQGSREGTGRRAEGPKMLPAVADGAGVTPTVGGAGEAVAVEHGAEDGGREGAGERERAAAR